MRKIIYKCDFCNKKIKDYGPDNYGYHDGEELHICDDCMKIIHIGIEKIIKKLKKDKSK